MGVRTVAFVGMAVRSLAVFAMALLAVLPWGEQVGAMSVLATALSGVLFSWAMHEENSPPLLVAFLAGLLIDTLAGGPLGYWALIMVALHGAGRLSAGNPPRRAPVRAVVAAALGAAAAGLASWLLAMVYVGALLAPWSTATGTLAAMAFASSTTAFCEIAGRAKAPRLGAVVDEGA